MNKIKEKIAENLSSAFFRSILTMVTGTVIAQFILILTSPIITRLYSPEDMGLLASFTAIVSILATVATGCYDQAIVLPKSNKESNAVAFSGLLFSTVFGIIVTITTIIFNNYLVMALKLKGAAASWLSLLGLFVVLTGIELVLNRVAIRNRHFRVIASTQITQQISSNGIKIGYGFYNSGPFGLFFSTLFGLISRIFRLSLTEFKVVFSKENRPSWNDIKSAAIRYKKFPLVGSWSGLLNGSSVQLPVVLFSAIYSPTVAGFYALSNKILNLPMSLVGQSIGNAFLERAAREKDNIKELGRITVELYKKLMLIGVFSMSFITFYGDILFPFVFGINWYEAGKYAQWISIWIVFQLAISPLTQVMNILERQGERLIWNIILCLSRISFVFFLFIDNVVIVIAIYSILSSLFYLAYALRIFILVEVKLTEIKDIWILSTGIYFIQFVLYLLLKFFIK